MGSYVRGLVAALQDLPEAPELVLVEGRLRARRGPLSALAGAPGTRRLGARGVARLTVGGAARLGLGLDRLVRVDVAHATDLAPWPLRARLPLVATVHDVFPLTRPAWFDARLGPRLARRLRDLAARADRWIVPTRHVAAQAVAVLGLDPRRVDVVPHGVAAAPAVAPADLGGPYLLAVGTLEPRKNHVRLAQAFAQGRARREGWRLVVAGTCGARASEARAALAADERIVLEHAPSAERLAALRAGAGAEIVASLDEGFGLTVLEGLAAGLPVLVGRGTGAAEVGGEAVLAVDVADVQALARGLDQLVAGPGPQRAAGDPGPQRAATFPWRSTAERTLASYRRAVEGRR